MHVLVNFDPISGPLGGQLGFPCGSQIVRSCRPIFQQIFLSMSGYREPTMDGRIKKFKKTHILGHFDPISGPLGDQLGFLCASQIVRSSRPIVQQSFSSITGNLGHAMDDRIEKNSKKRIIWSILTLFPTTLVAS